MKVSVVIPTLNSAATLEKCLASIRRNKTRFPYEIIVVDGGSTDGTVEIARKYADKVLIEDARFPKINRNKGVRAAEGEVICFTDSDCVVPENWIDGLVDALLRLSRKDEKVVGVGGGNVPLLEDPSLMELAIARVMRSPLMAFRARNVAVYEDERQVIHNPSLNAACFKWAFEEVGGFDEEHGHGGTDLSLDAKLTERGYKLYYIPNVLVYHKHRSTWRGFVKQMYAYGRGRIRVGRKYRRYLQFHHYGPIFLCLMALSPLAFIPLGMSLANAAYVSLKERNPLLFFPVLILTMTFYLAYGAGEIREWLSGVYSKTST